MNLEFRKHQPFTIEKRRVLMEEKERQEMIDQFIHCAVRLRIHQKWEKRKTKWFSANASAFYDTTKFVSSFIHFVKNSIGEGPIGAYPRSSLPVYHPRHRFLHLQLHFFRSFCSHLPSQTNLLHFFNSSFLLQLASTSEEDCRRRSKRCRRLVSPSWSS